MAKILDKIFSPRKKLIKLRQDFDWIKDELSFLDEDFEQQKKASIEAYAIKLNKRFVKAVKKIDVDRTKQLSLENKIQKYDVKNYLKHRALNHKTAKTIFNALKNGESWEACLAEHKKAYLDLIDSRTGFVNGLGCVQELTLDQAKVDQIEKIKQEFICDYEAKKAELSKAFDEKKAEKRARLEEKVAKLEAEINALKTKLPEGKTLPEGVLLEVKELKQYFGGLKAVNDLTFDVYKGEIFGLIGPNGAGKTTVFNCITRFYDATGGDMYFENKYGEVVDMRDFKVHDVILQGISRTFQNIEMVKEVTVLENLLIAATRYYKSGFLTQLLHLPLLKKEEKLMRAKADKVLKYMNLYAYRDRIGWGLPYGVLKRVEIARALMTNPKLIILDEPAAGLNESETQDLAELIDKIRKDFNCTILLVEHDMSLVMNICDHICAISFGKKLAYGTPAEIQASKEVQEAYLGVGGDE